MENKNNIYSLTLLIKHNKWAIECVIKEFKIFINFLSNTVFFLLFF